MLIVSNQMQVSSMYNNKWNNDYNSNNDGAGDGDYDNGKRDEHAAADHDDGSTLV